MYQGKPSRTVPSDNAVHIDDPQAKAVGIEVIRQKIERDRPAICGHDQIAFGDGRVVRAHNPDRDGGDGRAAILIANADVHGHIAALTEVQALEILARIEEQPFAAGAKIQLGVFDDNHFEVARRTARALAFALAEIELEYRIELLFDAGRIVFLMQHRV